MVVRRLNGGQPSESELSERNSSRRSKSGGGESFPWWSRSREEEGEVALYVPGAICVNVMGEMRVSSGGELFTLLSQRWRFAKWGC